VPEPTVNDAPHRKNPSFHAYLGRGMALGIAIGAGLGAAFGNVALGVGIGVGLGPAIALGMSALAKRRTRD
jgi:hypothetical protein